MKQSWFLASLAGCTLASCTSQPSSPPAEAQAPPAQAPAPEVAAQKPARPAQADPVVLRTAHAQALEWLAGQQAADGSWSGTAQVAINKVGLTGLALLALQSDGSTMDAGPHTKAVALGVRWLISQQKADSGLIGEQVGHAFNYDHAIATQALCTALKGTPNPQLKAVAQNATNFIAMARNPYGAWRYSVPPTGDNDTSVTGWMVEALMAAKAAGLTIDEQALHGARAWIDDVTDPKTARVGYDSIGSSSSRITGINDQVPTDQTEAMTASGMVTRMNTGQTADANPILGRHAELLRTRLPEWDVDGGFVDEYYWYFGSLASRRLGGKTWETWRTAMQATLLGSQAASGDARGSWAAAGPWAYAGGPVFSTALNALSLSTML